MSYNLEIANCKECGQRTLKAGLDENGICIHCHDPLHKAWLRQTTPSLPQAWIQWKGTNVCMDVHCLCGESFHVDDSFTYYLHCTVCDRVYMCNGHIELVELTEEEKPHALNLGTACIELVEDEDDKA